MHVLIRQRRHELRGELVGTRVPAAMEVGATAGLDARECAGQRELVARRRERRDPLDLGVEGEDRGPVARREAVDHVARAALGLLHGHTEHRAGTVEDQRQVQRLARDGSGGRRRRLDAGEDLQRVALVGR